MPAVPTALEFSIGVLSPTDLDTKLGDVLRFLMRRPHAMLRQGVTQTLVTSTATPITFTTEEVDDDVDGVGGHDNAINPSRYTARYAGWYQVGGVVAYAANATGRRACWWRVTGADINASATAIPAAAANATEAVAETRQVFLNVGDYVELIGYHERGANLDTFVSAMEASSMSVLWISN